MIPFPVWMLVLGFLTGVAALASTLVITSDTPETTVVTVESIRWVLGVIAFAAFALFFITAFGLECLLPFLNC